MVRHFTTTEQQHPSLVFFVGKRFKTVVLRDLYTSNNITRRKAHGIANLLVDFGSDTSRCPVLLADCTPGAACTSLIGPWSACHESRRHTMSGHSSRQEDMVAFLHVNLLFPFTHVVCVFADDLGGNRACASYIDSWIRQRRGRTTTSVEARPHLLVATTQVRDADALMQLECHDDFDLVFESFYFLTLDGSAALANCLKLRRTLNHVIDDARLLRQEQHLLFAGPALADAFSHAAEAISRDATTSTDLLTSLPHPARSLDDRTVARHLQHFLSLAVEHLPAATVIELLASALLVQGYPSTTHCEIKVRREEGCGS